MAECFVGGVTPRIVTGSFPVSSSTTGITVNLGGLPKYLVIKSSQKAGTTIGGNIDSIINPYANDTMSSGHVTIKVTETGFYVSLYSSPPALYTYYYFAVM